MFTINCAQDEMDTWQLDGLDGLEPFGGADDALPQPDVPSVPQRTAVPISAFSSMPETDEAGGGQQQSQPVDDQQQRQSASPPSAAPSQSETTPTSQELPPLSTMRSTSMGHSYARYLPETGEADRRPRRDIHTGHTAYGCRHTELAVKTRRRLVGSHVRPFCCRRAGGAAAR